VLATVILGVLAGALAERAEPHVRRTARNIMMAEAPATAVEWRLLSFAVCLVCAALLALFLGDGGALALSVGAVIGVFAPRVVARLRTRG